MEKDTKDKRAEGSEDGAGREEHGIVKRVRGQKNKLRAKEIKVIRSHLTYKPRHPETDYFSSTQFLSQLKEEKGQIKENRKGPGERSLKPN